jgi:hypothetical protein
MPDATSAVTTTAPSKRPEDLKLDDIVVPALILAGVLLVAAFFFWLAGRYRNQVVDDVKETGFSLTNFRKMYENGEISKEEYEKIRLKMAGKMKADLGLSPPPAPPPKSE